MLVLGCGGSGDDATAPDDDGGEDRPGGRVPEQLVGTWNFQDAGDVYRDPNTGACSSSYARSESLYLGADGTFEHALAAESSFPPCSLTVLHESEGMVEVDGSTLVLHIAEGRTRVEDTCGETQGIDESGESDRYTWELVGSGSGAAQLMLTDANGNPIGPFSLQR
ncbi:MAG TPA: hypothetical protein VNK43_04910 [Gemmatimonadales bacterium]|nr:hypothetical protein [Gemmatimonadales bacterium]